MLQELLHFKLIITIINKLIYLLNEKLQNRDFSGDEITIF